MGLPQCNLSINLSIYLSIYLSIFLYTLFFLINIWAVEERKHEEIKKLRSEIKKKIIYGKERNVLLI